jgi:uncharacterized membrane protein YczE/cytidylate kinase
MEKLKRYIIFFVGLFVNSLGVAMITKGSLGTSPISSIPYVLSLQFPFTLGEFTIAFSVFLVFLQLLLLRRNFKWEHALQIPVSVAFGYFIDLSMEILGFVNPQNYAAKILYLLLGCLILGIGVYTEVLADVVMLPGESFVRAVVMTFHTEFGTSKIVFDVSMAVIASALSFLFFGKLQGVREGTVVAALLVGFIARTLNRWLDFLPAKLFGVKADTGTKDDTAEKEHNICIVIGRQYGSGGHDYGKHLADTLGYAFYDNEMINMAAQSLGVDTEKVSREEESMTNSLLYDLVNQMYLYDKDAKATKDAIFEAQAKIMKELAAKGNCVIVGRCGDYILRDQPGVISLFLHAPEAYRVDRIAKAEQLPKEEVHKKIAQKDKLRAENYHYYTKRQWGMGENYTLCMDTTLGEACMDAMVGEVLKTL